MTIVRIILFQARSQLIQVVSKCSIICINQVSLWCPDIFFSENIPEILYITMTDSNAPAHHSLQSESAKIQIDFCLTISLCFDFQGFRYEYIFLMKNHGQHVFYKKEVLMLLILNQHSSAKRSLLMKSYVSKSRVES